MFENGHPKLWLDGMAAILSIAVLRSLLKLVKRNLGIIRCLGPFTMARRLWHALRGPDRGYFLLILALMCHAIGHIGVHTLGLSAFLILILMGKMAIVRAGEESWRSDAMVVVWMAAAFWTAVVWSDAATR
jgi:hypothetical protein